MSLIIFDQVNFALGAAPLLDECSFTIEKGERLALVGRNGAGKSTLLKLILGHYHVDGGIIKFSQGLRLGHLPQDLPEGDERSVTEVILMGLGKTGEALFEYDKLSQDPDPDLDRMSDLQHIIEENDGWHFLNAAKTIITKLTLDGDQIFRSLSGGWRRRVLLAQAFVCEPDILILDEPTNHLDIKMVEWLEETLLTFNGTLIFVSHDRSFIDRLATRVIDLDRGKISSYPAPYESYLEAKEKALDDEAMQRAKEDKVLAQEETWIRQGIKARRTRNEGRVRALKAMRTELSGRRNLQGTAKFSIDSDKVSGKQVVELIDASFGYEQKPLIDNFTATILRGDKIALIGPNGIGKSTLLKMLLGQLSPQSGQVIEGTKLEVAYFDQARMALDPEKTIVDAVSEGRDFIEIGGRNRHVISYLEDFLFAPDRARMKVKQLSGGETNRLLLAKLFSLSANLLVLDEPTNDLDMDTLELLIDRLSDFSGTVLIVSHDRYFIDQLATKTWAFEGNGAVLQYAGGYEDWKVQGGKWPEERSSTGETIEKPKATKIKEKKLASKKRSYKDQLEFDQMPGKIEALESQIETLEAEVATPDFYNSPADVTSIVLQNLLELQENLNIVYDRWVQLENMGE